MKSKRKLWVIVLTLACFFVGTCLWFLTPNNVSKVSAASASANASASVPARTTLHVSGRYEQLPFEDAADLPDNQSGIARPVALARADINSDGAPDLLATYVTEHGSELRVRLGSLSGNLDALPQTYSLVGGTPKALAHGDFNADGFQDIIVANSEAGSLSTLFGSEQGFKPGEAIKLSGNIAAIATADINRDGLEDIIAVDDVNNNLSIVISNGDLSRSTVKTITPKGLGRLSDVRIADFNNDNFADIVVVSNSGISVRYGDGKGNFAKETKLNYTNTVTGMVVADLDGDHFPDIAVAGPTGVTAWYSRLQKGFTAAKSFPAGDSVQGLVAGNFNGDDFTDLAVINRSSSQVSVLLNKKGRNFSEPLAMDVDGDPMAIASGNFRLNSIDGIAIAKNDGRTVLAIQPQAVTLQVSTLFDENDCPNCTSAQLKALKGPLGAPGGGTGISLREALTSINNDFVINGTVNQGVGFMTLSSTSGANNANVESDTRSICGDPATSNQQYWFIFVNGDLPPILAPGTIVDGTVVNTSALSGANNTLGPKVVVSGGGFLVTSSAPNSVIKGLSIINAPNNAISIASNGNMVTQNAIGLDCDTVTPGPNTLNGVLLSGSSNTTVSNNFIGTSGLDGIQVNGISLFVPVPQNNTFTNNSIGINRLGFTVDVGTGASVANLRDGVRIQAGATGNTVSNSVIGGNLGYGVNVSDDITSNAIIKSNRIGIDPSGQQARPNVLDGVSISTLGNSKFNQVTSNLISGNGVLGITGPGFGNGVSISSGDVQAQFNVVAVNKIGVNSTGSVQVPNFGDGVLITGSANGDTIGGLQSANGNQISGNGGTGIEIGGAVGLANPNNNVVINNSIGPNNLGTGAPFDPLTPALNLPRSNKGGGMIINGAAFANTIFQNVIAFNSDTGGAVVPNGLTTPPTDPTSGLTHSSTGNFNTFSSNNIFLNPPDISPTTPNINALAGNEGMLNTLVDPTAITSLIKIDSAVTVTTTGQTTIKGTANFLDNGIQGNINNAVIEVFVSKRGSETIQALSEGQLFLNGVISFQPNSLNPNTVDWSASLVIPAPFLNPVQTNTLFLTATITTGDGSTSPYSFGRVPQFVSGVGQCALSVTPNPVSFTNVPVGTSGSQDITITNTGNSLITITSLGFNQTNTAYSLTSSQQVPFTLGAGGTATVTVKFTPTNNTSQAVTLNIGNSCTGTTNVNITGTGCQVTLAASPNPVNFGSVNVGQTTTMNVTVTSSGCGSNQTVAFTASLANQSASAFSISKVAGNVVTLGFSPGAAGTFTGTLVITSANASNSPLMVPLNGTGINPPTPVLRVNPANVIFGDVPVNTTATQSVTLMNAGNSTLNISTPVVQSGASAGFSVSTPPRLTLQPNESTTLQVSFKPTQTGPATGTVLISSDGGNQTITLTGNGTAATISVGQQSIDFGMITSGTSATRTVVINNTGSAPLNISSFSINGGSAFSLPNTAPFTIAPNGTGSITVNFNPTNSGTQTGTLVINSNDPNRPTVNVSLTGSGSDATAPVVSIVSPSGGEGIGGGQQFTVRFNASDNVGVTTFDIRLSTNGGSSFDFSLGSGTAQSGQNTFTAVAPTGIETSQARIQVQVRDAANNVGTAVSSGSFAIGTPPTLFNPTITNGKFKTLSANSNIQNGAVLVVNGETFTLTLNAAGTKFVVKKNATSASGKTLRTVASSGSTVTVTVRNPNGISSSPATINVQ